MRINHLFSLTADSGCIESNVFDRMVKTMMHVERRTGSVGSVIFATIRQGRTTHQIATDVRADENGLFLSRMPDGRWSAPCRSVESALLMHAAIVFPVEIATSPWLANQAASPFRTPAHRAAYERTARQETDQAGLAERAPYCATP
jgi:hypothetical protein